MIKFFRKFRQELLSEGKTGKYLKYAIGEIVLVVIGILIALQINNWNQIRLDKEKERIILSKFIEDFKQDALNIKTTLSNVEQKIKVTLAIYHEIYTSDSTKDSLSYFQFSSAISNSLSLKERNQEYVNQINNFKVRNSLIEYFYLEEGYEQQLNNLNDFTRDKIRQYLGENGLQKLDYIYTKNSLEEIFSHTNSIYDFGKIKELQKDDSFKNILFQLRMNSLSVLASGNNLLEENDKLIQEMKATIK